MVLTRNSGGTDYHVAGYEVRNRIIAHGRSYCPRCFRIVNQIGYFTVGCKFSFRNFHKGVTQTVRGASHLVLDAQGLVTLHRDYWDATEELYEKLPVVGALMRWLKQRANS